MTIPKLTPYTGQVANPDGSQTQTEFTQNMFDQLSYEAQLATQLEATIDGMNSAVDEVEANAVSAENSASAAEAAAASAGYQGLWPDSGGSALKGEIWQTQVGGTPTGNYYTALQNTSVDPVGDNVNWRSFGSVNGYDVTQSDVDTSLGDNGEPRLLKVGDGGHLSTSLRASSVDISGDFLAALEVLPTGVYSVFKPDLTSNIPPGFGDRGTVEVRKYNVSDTYITLRDNNGRLFTNSRYNAAWVGWQRYVSDDNFETEFENSVETINFTPTLEGGTVAGEYTAPVMVGTSIKVGNLVTVMVTIQLITQVVAGSGALKIGGFPVKSSNNDSMNLGSVGSAYLYRMKEGSTITAPFAKTLKNSDAVTLYDGGTVDPDWGYANIQIEDVIRTSANLTRIGFTVQYLAA